MSGGISRWFLNARRAAVSLFVFALVASCRGGDGPPAESVSPGDTTAPVEAAPPGDTTVLGAPLDTIAIADTNGWIVGIVDRERPESGAALLVAVRAATHEDFDRVVFEFAGTEPPGIHLEYIDRPVRDCGAGHVVPIEGDGWLAVRFYPANAHDESGAPTAGPREIAPRLPIVLEIERTCDFEAVVEYVLGVAVPNRYRLIELADPVRVVVDVRHHR